MIGRIINYIALTHNMKLKIGTVEGYGISLNRLIANVLNILYL